MLAHIAFNLHIHLVFVTKYRQKVLSELTIRELKEIFTAIYAALCECDGKDDHVHLLVQYPPKVKLSTLINNLKGVSSRYIRENIPEILGSYRKTVLWSHSYFAGSFGGAPLSVIAEYVKQQRKKAAFPPQPKGPGIHAEFKWLASVIKPRK